MWFFDGCTVIDVIADAKRPGPMPFEEWFKLDNPLYGAGAAAERLREQLDAPAEDAAATLSPES